MDIISSHTTEDDHICFHNYLVIFLDILGQRSRLRRIKTLPTEGDSTEFIKKLKETFGKVDALRMSFRNFFEGADLYVPAVTGVPAEAQEDCLACLKSEAYYYGFSDSMIIAVPLANNDDNCTAVNGVFRAFTATCGISLLALSGKIPLRGGLDVGIAAQINDNEIYGPALERAYYLESNVAQYPRFAIGRELIGYLSWVGANPSTSLPALTAKERVKICKEMICEDTDGIPMLDFCGTRVKETIGHLIDADIVKLARAFADTQYKAYSEEDDYKLASRYFRLARPKTSANN